MFIFLFIESAFLFAEIIYFNQPHRDFKTPKQIVKVTCS